MTNAYEKQVLAAQDLIMRGSHKLHFPPNDIIVASHSNHEITGIQNWMDLEEMDCDAAYKNEFETAMDFKLTKTLIMNLYETQLQQLIDYGSERGVQVQCAETSGSFISDRKVSIERFRFEGGAQSAGHFLKAILAQYKRRSWDKNIADMRVVAPVINQNMLIIEELSEELVPGVNERELLIKRFIFRD